MIERYEQHMPIAATQKHSPKIDKMKVSMAEKIRRKDKERRVRHQQMLLKKYVKDYEVLA